MTLTLNKFDEINHLPLRVFNRVVFLNNLTQDSGKEAGQKYVSLFTEDEKKQMYVMARAIQHKGQDAVRKEVTRNLVVVDEDYNADV